MKLYDVSFKDYFGYIVWASSVKSALEFALDHYMYDCYLQPDLEEILCVDVGLEDGQYLEKLFPFKFWEALEEMADIKVIDIDQNKEKMVFEYTLNL